MADEAHPFLGTIPEHVALREVLGCFEGDLDRKLAELKGAVDDMLGATTANKIQGSATIAECLCIEIIGEVRTLSSVRIRVLSLTTSAEHGP